MNSYSRLFVWVEGEDDGKFFENVLQPKLQEKYDSVKIVKYATLKKEKIDNYIKSIKSMGANYIYVTDINDSPCVTAKKERIQAKFKNIDGDKIIVVIKEIESWYLARIDDKVCKKLKLRNFDKTDNIRKEQFNTLIPKKFSSRIDFMLEILKNYSIENAKQKNRSFRYYIEKYDC